MSASRGIEANEGFLNKEIEGRHPGQARSADPGSHNRQNFAIADQVRNDVTSLPSYLPIFLPSKRAAYTKPSRATKIAKQSERRVCVNGNVEFSSQTRAVAFNARRSFARCAFTLAEVLITLVIVGVIAVLTIAPLVQNYKKKQTVTRLKSVYSQLNQAVKFSEAENGDFANIDLSENNSFEKYIVPYLKIAEKYEYGNRYLKDVTPYLQSSGKEEVALALFRIYKNVVRYTLANGVDIITSNKILDLFMVDINGTNNGPNKFGKDAFCFDFRPGYNFFPFGYVSISEFTVPENTHVKREMYKKKNAPQNYGCNKAGRGVFCAALIMLDGWEISKDYPW